MNCWFELLCAIPSGVDDSTIAVGEKRRLDDRYALLSFNPAQDMKASQQSALCEAGIDAMGPSFLVCLFACCVS